MSGSERAEAAAEPRGSVAARIRVMDPKLTPNRQQYIDALRAMTPQQRLAQAFELSDLTRRLLVTGLRQRHPDLSDDEVRQLATQRIAECHNRNY